jgi:hypothetical protein
VEFRLGTRAGGFRESLAGSVPGSAPGDRYDAVRFIAERSLRRLPGFHDFEYDFVGPPEQRAAAHQRALEIWASAQKSQERPFAAPMLIDGQGRVQQTLFERLWKQRDDRPMKINE